eukprot:jgi/Mesen1/6736/ME000344S06018
MLDELVAAAVQEIATEGIEGCPLSRLWLLLQKNLQLLDLPLDTGVKQAIWLHILQEPDLKAVLPAAVGQELALVEAEPGAGNSRARRKDCRADDTCQPAELQDQHPARFSVQEAEAADVALVASQKARESALGLYELTAVEAGLNAVMIEALHRIARAREKGVMQAQLAKDLSVSNNNFFYVLRSLEARNLICRQSLLVRDPSTSTPVLVTNVVHLARYARTVGLSAGERFTTTGPTPARLALTHPAPGQRALELEDEEEEEYDGGGAAEGDAAAAATTMADGGEFTKAVLVRAELKSTLGYRFTVGHRTWRRLQHRLTGAGIISVFPAQVDGKVVTCVKSLRPFEGSLDPKPPPPPEEVEDELDASGAVRRGEVTALIGELPVDRQVYDMVESSGVEGIVAAQIWRTLGLDGKKNLYITQRLCTTYGVIQSAEVQNKSTVYRLRTAANAALAAARPQPRAPLGGAGDAPSPSAPGLS